MIRIGTAGWQYRDWAGIVYPKPKPRGFDELACIASFFDTVEINTSFYGPPRREVAQAWVERVADNPTFRFTAKLWKGFTHERNASADDERLFKEGMEPLISWRGARTVPLVLPKRAGEPVLPSAAARPFCRLPASSRGAARQLDRARCSG